MRKRIMVATHNKGKLREYKDLLEPLGYEVIGEAEAGVSVEPEETGSTYAENAYIKAKALRPHVDCPVISDDSGIEIDALGKHFPGIKTARYAESQGGFPAVFDVILKEIKGKTRAASFHCCICLLEEPDSEPKYFCAVCPGRILNEPRGDHGFGYDPIFHSDENDLDFGVCTEEQKSAVSHRGKALRKLVAYLASR
jgi:XTP/dITP diphosphohydrolase